MAGEKNVKFFHSNRRYHNAYSWVDRTDAMRMNRFSFTKRANASDYWDHIATSTMWGITAVHQSILDEIGDYGQMKDDILKNIFHVPLVTCAKAAPKRCLPSV